MNSSITLIFGTLAASAVAFAQLGPAFTPTDAFQIGYAANLNIGESVLNMSNSGWQGGFINAVPPTVGNICANVYIFDPQEEEISCCSCLITPNGLNSIPLSTLTLNTLTPAIPTSIIVKLLASQPGTNIAGAFMTCNASGVALPTTLVTNPTASAPYAAGQTGYLAGGLIAWGTTIEPQVAGYNVVSVDYKKEMLSASELSALVTTCGFVQTEGSGFGVCPACANTGLSGAKN
jgi:hypothetical protein